MPVPTHSPSCVTRAFPLNCQYSGAEVFYFFCSCGSKVFFDELGYPWPIHACFDETTSSIIDDLLDVYGSVDQTTLNHLKRYAEEHELEFEEKQLKIIENYLKRGIKAPTRIEVKPEDKSVTIQGEILSIDRNINFYKRFNMPENKIAEQLLGVLTKEKYNEMTIVVTDNYKNEIIHYKAVIPADLANKMNLSQKQNLITKLDVHEIVGKGKCWLIDEIEVLGRK